MSSFCIAEAKTPQSKARSSKQTKTTTSRKAPAYSSNSDTQARIAALEEKIKKLESEAVLVSKKDLQDGKLPKPFVASANPRSSVTLGGQVNRFLAYRNNGNRSRLEHLDSTASSSRVNITGTGYINPQLATQAVIETELTDGVLSTLGSADIGSAPVGSAFSDTSPVLRNRRVEAVFKHEKFGTLYIGKGHTSSDSVSEVDFSGTTAISNGSEGPNNLGGFRFYNKTLRVSDGQRIASDALRNMDGLQRANRIRYDTPSMGGVVLGFSHTNADQTDQSVRYAANFGKTKFGIAVAHTYQPFLRTTTPTGGTQSRRHHTYHGSFSIYNNGFSFGAAGGVEKYSVPREPSPHSPLLQKRKNATFWFTKIGYQTKFINCGKTAFAIDYTYTKANSLAETDYFLVNGERGESYAFTAVQNFDMAGTEIYFVAREYKFRQPFASYKSAHMVLVGTRVKF